MGRWPKNARDNLVPRIRPVIPKTWRFFWPFFPSGSFIERLGDILFRSSTALRWARVGRRALPLPSQCVRLFAALLPGVPPAAYLRVTDADMLITNTSWLLPHNTAAQAPPRPQTSSLPPGAVCTLFFSKSKGPPLTA